ncbi:MAG: hypothetical protein A7316_06690 [Candidatus Altiarchaeales archaeon WOR_SM1_86-2]|nr:MAG: hypothetical protein A7316_06690 [Candidatus Altiarchaeales archaeon WOR_SM1_86-2]
MKLARKVDSWKQKSRYRIVAPEEFNSQEVGVTVAADPKKLVGRTLKVTIRDLTGDKTKQHLNLIFEIGKVRDSNAYTKFKRFEVSRNYLKGLVKADTSKIDHIHDIDDSNNLRIKTVVITRNRIKTSQKNAINSKISEILDGYKDANLKDLVEQSLSGKLNTRIYREIKNVCPIQRVEIREIRAM